MDKFLKYFKKSWKIKEMKNKIVLATCWVVGVMMFLLLAFFLPENDPKKHALSIEILSILCPVLAFPIPFAAFLGIKGSWVDRRDFLQTQWKEDHRNYVNNGS